MTGPLLVLLILAPLQREIAQDPAEQGGPVEAEPVPEGAEPELIDDEGSTVSPEAEAAEPVPDPAAPAPVAADDEAGAPGAEPPPPPEPDPVGEAAPVPDPAWEGARDLAPAPAQEDTRPPTPDERAYPPDDDRRPPLPHEVNRPEPAEGLLPAGAVAAAQGCTGLGVCAGAFVLSGAVGMPISFIPVVGPLVGPCCLQAGFCAANAGLGGYLQALLGESLSGSRGAWAPVVAAHVVSHLVASLISSVVGGVLMGAASVLVLSRTGVPDDPAVLSALLFSDPGVLLATAVSSGIFLVLIAAAVAVPTATWWLLAEPRRPGDDGSFRMPGALEPNHPEGTVPAGQTWVRAAMRY